MMLPHKPNASAIANVQVSHPDLLAERLVSPASLVALAQQALPAPGAHIHSLPTLHQFLDDYRTQLLVPREWPAIQAAYQHACRQHTRELIAVDREFSLEPDWTAFAAASQRLGRQHLRALRPLRDQRLVQRYRQAVQCGEAHGWHVVVYGVILALYSLPLRQGLLSYAWLTLNGFIQAAAPALKLAETDGAALLEDLYASLPARLEPLLAHAPKPAGA
jgi:urease accessory protein UreF